MWYDEAAKLSGHMAAEAPANAGVFSWAVVPASDEPIMQAGGSTCQVLETAAPLEAPKGGFEGPTTIETALPKPQGMVKHDRETAGVSGGRMISLPPSDCGPSPLSGIRNRPIRATYRPNRGESHCLLQTVFLLLVCKEP